MKKILGKIGTSYVAIGGVFGMIQWFSYAWGATWGMPPGGTFISNAMAGAVMLAVGTLSGVLRVFLWLPSLLLWALGDHRVSFLYWFATGLFVTRDGQ